MGGLTPYDMARASNIRGFIIALLCIVLLLVIIIWELVFDVIPARIFYFFCILEVPLILSALYLGKQVKKGKKYIRDERARLYEVLVIDTFIIGIITYGMVKTTGSGRIIGMVMIMLLFTHIIVRFIFFKLEKPWIRWYPESEEIR